MVIIVVLVIAVPAIIAIMWLGIVGSVIEEETQDVTMNLASPSMSQRTIDSETYWDASIGINKITPNLAVVSYTDIRVIAKAADGHVLLTSTRPKADSPTNYDDGSDGSVDVQVWYDSTLSSPMVFAGDSFKLTGLTAEWEGASIEITDHGDRIGSIVLPTDFP